MMDQGFTSATPPPGRPDAPERSFTEVEDNQFEAVVGRNWHRYYRKRFARAAVGRWAGFNLAACFFGPTWFAYRRMYLASVVFAVLIEDSQTLALDALLPHASHEMRRSAVVACILVWGGITGGVANIVYASFAQNRVTRASRRDGDADAVAKLRRNGGPLLWAGILQLILGQAFRLWVHA